MNRDIPIMFRMAADAVEIQGRQLAGTLVPARNIAGDGDDDTQLLRQMAEEARTYIASFSWCKQIDGAWFGGGVGGIFAVFLFHIRPGRPEVAPWMWVVVGDIPSAYLPISDAASSREVFEAYVDGMRRWVKAARNGDKKAATAADVPPVDVPPTPEWADELKVRLHTLEQVIRPFFLK